MLSILILELFRLILSWSSVVTIQLAVPSFTLTFATSAKGKLFHTNIVFALGTFLTLYTPL